MEKQGSEGGSDEPRSPEEDDISRGLKDGTLTMRFSEGPFHCEHGTHLFLASGCSECSDDDLPGRSTAPPYGDLCMASITDRNDEHREYVCYRPRGHADWHRRGNAEWSS